MLVDSHCHLDFADFTEDFDAVLERARSAGVVTLLTIGTHLAKFPQVRAIAERHPHVWCSVGVHPHEAESAGADVAAVLLELAAHPRVVGIGETGLDYYYDHSDRAAQIASFRGHIAAARTSGLPLIVHSRDADDDMAAILEEEAEQGAFTGVIHCFTAGPRLAERALALGFYLSFSGILTFKNAGELREIAATVPADRLLVETDAPYLAPVPMRGKRNEPAFVAHTAARLAELRGVGAEVLAQQTAENFHRLFAKSRPAPAGAA